MKHNTPFHQPARIRSSARRSPATAFTLIELMVVIAIIGLLAAILFPVFSRVRENARRSTCQSNLKQIGLGIMQYIQDNDDTMPRSYFTNTPFGGKEEQDTGDSNAAVRYKWMDAAFPYVKSEQLFSCPSADAKSVGIAVSSYTSNRYRYRSGATGAGVASSRIHGSYVINNGYPNVTDWVLHGPLARKMSAIQTASSTILVADGNGGEQFGPPNNLSVLRIVDTVDPNLLLNGSLGDENEAASAMVQRHLETTNVLFCDGHVKAQRLTDYGDASCVKYDRFGNKANINTDLVVEVATPATGCP